jgi:hypothetical protein
LKQFACRAPSSLLLVLVVQVREQASYSDAAALPSVWIEAAQAFKQASCISTLIRRASARPCIRLLSFRVAHCRLLLVKRYCCKHGFRAKELLTHTASGSVLWCATLSIVARLGGCVCLMVLSFTGWHHDLPTSKCAVPSGAQVFGGKSITACL